MKVSTAAPPVIVSLPGPSSKVVGMAVDDTLALSFMSPVATAIAATPADGQVALVELELVQPGPTYSVAPVSVTVSVPPADEIVRWFDSPGAASYVSVGPSSCTVEAAAGAAPKMLNRTTASRAKRELNMRRGCRMGAAVQG